MIKNAQHLDKTEQNIEQDLLDMNKFAPSFKKSKLTVEYIKSLGKLRSKENLSKLLFLYELNLPLEIKREITSSIGRQNELPDIYQFIKSKAFIDDTPMDVIYQMYRTCLYNSKLPQFKELGESIASYYSNEVIDKMTTFYLYKSEHKKQSIKKTVTKPLLLVGDNKNTLKIIPSGEVKLIFTSPPYYNAREYSNYTSYKKYLSEMLKTLHECFRVLDDGRFIIINVSPVITARPGREFESIRYPIHFDFHKILEEAGFYFIDEIIWIKPESTVKNRIGGYIQNQRPLNYKPNCITESIMIYRKKAPFLLDVNIKQNKEIPDEASKIIDTTNCWYINPKSSKKHSAVFPEELCEKILKYYSFKNEVVLDPFAGSGTFGNVATKMQRLPILCENNPTYVDLLRKNHYDEI